MAPAELHSRSNLQSPMDGGGQIADGNGCAAMPGRGGLLVQMGTDEPRKQWPSTG
jgi:hypothetical protein